MVRPEGRAASTSSAMRMRDQASQNQARLSDFIAEVVANWDAATITDKLELHVGKDLQYVRVNGTLVGFLVGGLVYAVLRATFGSVSF